MRKPVVLDYWRVRRNRTRPHRSARRGRTRAHRHARSSRRSQPDAGEESAARVDRLDPRSAPRSSGFSPEFEVDLVFHLAALLSTRSEFSPRTAHEVNVEGTLNLLEFAQHEGESHGRPVTFLYPSSIAAFGLPSLEAKTRGRPRARRSVQSAGDDVWVQQAVLRAAGLLLLASLQAAVRRAAPAGAWISARCVSRV